MSIETTNIAALPPHKRPRCFVIEQPTRTDRNIADTSEFGQLTYLFPPECRRPSIFDCDRMADAIEKALLDFDYDPDNDYLVLAGSLILVASVTTVIGDMFARYKALLYDIQKSRYIPKELGRATQQ